MDRFAYMQNLHVRKIRFTLGLNEVKSLHIRKFCIYTQFFQWKNCVHMDRFAYVSKICVYVKFAYVSKSGHMNEALHVPLGYMNIYQGSMMGCEWT